MVWAHDLAFRVLSRMRVAVFDGLERTAPGGLQKRRTGELVGTAMHDVETLEWFYAHTAPTMVAAVVAPGCTLVAVAVVAGDLAFLGLGGLLVAGAVPWLLRRTADRQGARIRAEAAELKARCLETVQGLREVLGFGRLADQRTAIDVDGHHVYAAQRRYALRSGVETAVAEVAVAATAVAFLIVGVGRVRAGELDPGALSVATVLALAAFAPVLELGGMVAKLGELGAAAARVRGIADAAPNVTDPVGEAREHSATARAARQGRSVAVRLEDVGLSYEEGREPALSGITLSLPPGSSLALVGRSGAGKSSLAHLLLRLWDPTRGRILLDGEPLSGLCQR
ncbi:MAG: ABC transporter transmembrane domain-containing protein, partial [Nocardioides sp.]